MNNGPISSNNHSNDSMDGGFSDDIIFTIGQELQTGTATEQSAEVTYRVQGLDKAIIHDYPKILFSQVKNRHSVSSYCFICLVDFNEDDELRMLPDCGHFYHVSCIDSWLKLHPTCPTCRNLPVRASESSMPAEEVTVRVE